MGFVPTTPGIFSRPHQNLPPDNHSIVHAAYFGEAEVPSGGIPRHDKSHFVHVSRQHDFFPGRFLPPFKGEMFPRLSI